MCRIFCTRLFSKSMKTYRDIRFIPLVYVHPILNLFLNQKGGEVKKQDVTEF